MTKRPKLDVDAIRGEAAGHSDLVEQATRPRSRDEKEQINAWITPGYRKRLKRIAVDEERTVESLIDESIRDLLEKYEHRSER